MNAYPDFKGFFKDVAQKLTLLGREPGKVNLFFIEDPETVTVLLGAIRNKLTLPCLAVEMYDEDKENGDAQFRVLTSAFIVLDQAKKPAQGATDIEAAIYERCKPAADQIFAKMKQLSDRMQLVVDGKKVNLVGDNAGNWVGPIVNDLYGWRVEFKWRFAGGVCLDPSAWDE
ncbi:hypothetical protein SAMN05216327_101193 [Dyadobacter sp. SG02]|uniref:hypothetical protein n=1 Tax=Dyadobacter sp. SG02 TaxID=1855291 RepID=UPI0008D1FAE5|nr:hypothetical protein [Dyadobacter sp. SG02]SEI39402.1 hypothetical protein SAMN05216327_101193 [Dyadobacter sp. SG02]